MKRSEMVNIIRRELDAQIGDSVSECFDLSQLLAVIEASGMLPPDIALCHPDLKHVCHEWDEEDEV